MHGVRTVAPAGASCLKPQVRTARRGGRYAYAARSPRGRTFQLRRRLAQLGAQRAELEHILRELLLPRAQRALALLEIRRGALSPGDRLVGDVEPEAAASSSCGHRLVGASARVSQRAGEDLRAGTQHLR